MCMALLRTAGAVVGLTSRSNLAAVLLVTCAARNYGWDFFPPELKGLASKGLGALATLVLLWAVYRLAQRSRTLLLVLLWFAYESAQTAICSFSYMLWPWPVEAGQAMCSAKLGFDLGAIGILAGALILQRLVNSNTLQGDKK